VLCYLNGQFLPRASAMIPVEDRGFIFADGVYEVWRTLDGGLFELESHLARLRHGLRELRIAPPDIAGADVLQSVSGRLLAESDLLDGDATLYVEVTRGAAPRTHQFPAQAVTPTVFAMVNRLTPADAARARGASVITVPDERWLRCDLKTIQLLPNILAKQAAAERHAIEAVLIRDGVVTEGSHTNVLAVFDGVVRTHPLGNLVLPGVTRALVLDIARAMGIPVDERAFRATEIPRADELFLVGTTTDIMPVVRVDGQPVGTGKPGELTMRLYDELRSYMDGTRTRDSFARDVAPARG
jgi:D-alanine transaminase